MSHDKELKEKVFDWVNNQGYPLEMQAAQEFWNEGFDVVQSAYYLDPQTEESREIDVIAEMKADRGDCALRLTICVECKVIKARPWGAAHFEKSYADNSTASRRESGNELGITASPGNARRSCVP